MNKTHLKKFRLSLLFALIVFVVMLAAMILVACGAFILEHFHLLTVDLSGRIPLFYFALVSLIVGGVIAFMTSGTPLRPLRKIMDATDRIADGDYSVRLNLKGPEEFRELSAKFNHMAEELGSVELLRSDFVSNFSHEFKTPIVSIRGFAKALKWEDLTDAERTEYLDIIIEESERLSELSTNVLYLSKIESQSILTERRTFNLSEQIRLAAALLDRKMSAKKIDLSFDSAEYFITGNEEMLKQVWINILDNAVKFSPEGGQIRIRIRNDATSLAVSIFNEGKCLTPEEQARIFDKFYQADTSHSTAGNGLGLSIAKKIVDLHGGTIGVLSSENGNTFEIKLPAFES